MTTNAAIVDDRDPLIQYAGTWNGAGSSAEFYSTTTWSPRQGSTASLSFVGTSVAVYGSVAAKNPSDSSLTFVVDGSITGTYTPPSNMSADIHHEALWTSPAMSSGTHTLVITQTTAQTDGVIFLDYIMYDTTSTSQPYFIDDRDPRITYTPAWTQEGSDEDFQHTVQRTSATGDSFSLEFEGQSISFYGGVTSHTMNASVVIDGGPPTLFGAPTGATTTNNLFFHSGDLPAGTHTMVVTAENDQYVWADYFIANQLQNTPSSSGPTLSTSPSSTAAPFVTSSSSPKPTPIGAIVGSVIGAVVVLVALATAIILLCRRRRRHQPPTLPISNAFQPTPFANFVASGAADGYPAVTAPNNPTAGYPWPNSGTSSNSNSTSKLANLLADPVNPVQTGFIPSSKLLREAQRYAGSSGQGAPPQYFE